MLEILAGTSDGDLLEVVSNLQSSTYILTIPQKTMLHIFYINIVNIPRKTDQMNEYFKIHPRNEL